ncbi:MAG: Cof-type HAD-IIB family hydrolase [Treponema sp.]|jgi:Cof subfamily protein (haloacid dehalogenase superfamily)|nr:Cof-type HAD-IIB family hydrolase [Treponema sp.]
MNRKFEPKKIKALAIDLDGTTLLPNTTLGDRTVSVLQKLIAQKMQIIIATGRAIESSESYRSCIGAQGPMVFFNGAVVADVPSGKIVSANLIDTEVADYGIDIAREMGIHYQIYMPAGISPQTGEPDPLAKWGALLIDKQCPESEAYRKHTGIVPVVMDLKRVTALPALKGCVKSMFITDPSLHDEIRLKMNNRFGSRINITRSSPTFLEILNNGVSKGAGLVIAMRCRGLVPEEVIAFGDEENDLPLFSAAGFAAAPLSAGENIRRAADVVFGSNADEGLAVYLEEVFGV